MFEEEKDGVKPQIHMRCYLIRTKKGGEKLPKVDLEEMGPRIDFRVGRVHESDPEMMKEAMRRPKTTEVSMIDLTSSVPIIILTFEFRPSPRRISRPTRLETRLGAFTWVVKIFLNFKRGR